MMHKLDTIGFVRALTNGATIWRRNPLTGQPELFDCSEWGSIPTNPNYEILGWKSHLDERELNITQRETNIDLLINNAYTNGYDTHADHLYGPLIELLGPMSTAWPYSLDDTIHIGTPGHVDYLAYDGLYDGALREIAICEVKSGRGKLTPKQKAIRDAINGGIPLRFMLFRIQEKGGKLIATSQFYPRK